jgi:hypothetical protein
MYHENRRKTVILLLLMLALAMAGCVYLMKELTDLNYAYARKTLECL